MEETTIVKQIMDFIGNAGINIELRPEHYALVVAVIGVMSKLKRRLPASFSPMAKLLVVTGLGAAGVGVMTWLQGTFEVKQFVVMSLAVASTSVFVHQTQRAAAKTRAMRRGRVSRATDS